jgi:hypothetical protein
MDWAYHPDFGGLAAYEIKSLPEGADGQVRETIREVAGHVLRDANDPLVMEHAGRALQLGNGCPITGVWNWVKPRIRFQQDEDTARRLHIVDRRVPDIIEVVIPPRDQARLIEMGRGVEDCDGFTGYAECLLLALGVPIKFVTVSADAEQPTRFSHVYVASYLNGRRIPLDFSHGEYPGWECPNTGRLQEWDLSIANAPSGETVALVAAALLAAAWIGLRHYGKRAA